MGPKTNLVSGAIEFRPDESVVCCVSSQDVLKERHRGTDVDYEVVMKGSLVLEKLNSPALRREWDRYLSELGAALKALNAVKHTAINDPGNLAYMEAVLRFAEARDEERTFFWQSFIEERIGVKVPK